MLSGCISIAILTALPWSAFPEQTEIPSVETAVEGHARMNYFLMGPKKKGEGPKAGYGLLVVLPGGSGGREFNGFCKSIYKQTLGNDWIAAQPIAIRWTDKQTIIWPTSKNRVSKMEFTTEEFVQKVIVDVSRRHRLDPARIFLLAWSSGGPAAYAISLQQKKLPTGFYIAMSVFRTQWLPALTEA
ncbi:MAG: hypothetical protein O6952_03060, partial [Planctomycetota bacterium]|nr:hypothetical protein [Planctomycetota bacterium]